MSNDKIKYELGFKHGYYLHQFEPETLQRLIRNLDKEKSFYSEGLLSGGEIKMRELQNQNIDLLGEIRNKSDHNDIDR